MEIKNTFNLLYSFWHMLPINISMTRHILKQHLPLSMMSQTDINVIFIQKLRADNFIISLSSSNLNLIKYIKTCMHTQHISYLYPINNKHLKSKSTIRVVLNILGKNLTLIDGKLSDPSVGKIPWRRKWLPTPVFWPGEFHGLYSPWGRRVGHD